MAFYRFWRLGDVVTVCNSDVIDIVKSSRFWWKSAIRGGSCCFVYDLELRVNS